MFAADAALDNLLASSAPKPRAKASAKPKPAAKKASAPSARPAAGQERQQLNVEVENDLFTALNLRKTRAKLAGNKGEDSYCKIVELALREYLAREVELASMMEG